MLRDQHILLGVTGSIAAYKSVDLARRFIEKGARVQVVMTGAACRFITPYTFETLTGRPVCTDLFKDPFSHIQLTREADLFIIAPATANTINKLSCGIADNLLTTLWLTHEGPVLMAPAMNFRMYANPIVKKHIKELKKLGVQFVGPESGSLACGEEGEGRMVAVEEIYEAAATALTAQDLKGHTILVTAGPTREPIDPVRFISNRSSGKMGFAIARAALRRGAEVTLVSGPSALTPPGGASFVMVERASQMENEVLKHLKKATTVIMAAAVSDYASPHIAKAKIKRKGDISLKLNVNTDILRKLGKKKGNRILIGFAAESGKDIRSAIGKLTDKNLDMIVLNDISQQDAGFDGDTNIVTIINKNGQTTDYPKMTKIEVADEILDGIIALKRGKA